MTEQTHEELVEEIRLVVEKLNKLVTIAQSNDIVITITMVQPDTLAAEVSRPTFKLVGAYKRLLKPTVLTLPQ